MKEFDKFFINGEYIKAKDTTNDATDRLVANMYLATGLNGSALEVANLQKEIEILEKKLEDLSPLKSTNTDYNLTVSNTSYCIQAGMSMSITVTRGSAITASNIKCAIIGDTLGTYGNSTNIGSSTSGYSTIFTFSGLPSIYGEHLIYFYDQANPSRRSPIVKLYIISGSMANPTYDYSVKKVYTNASNTECAYIVSCSMLGFGPIYQTSGSSGDYTSVENIGEPGCRLDDSRKEYNGFNAAALRKNTIVDSNGRGYTAVSFAIPASDFEGATTITLQLTFSGKTTNLTINTADYI